MRSWISKCVIAVHDGANETDNYAWLDVEGVLWINFINTHLTLTQVATDK